MNRMIPALLVVLATGCASAANDTPQREVDFHIDLSGTALEASAPVFLHANGRRYLLEPHNDTTYQALLRDFDSLDFTEPSRVTHFADNVQVRAGALNHIYLTRGDARFDPDHQLLLSFYHSEPADDVQSAPSKLASEGLAYACDISAAVAMVFNHPELMTDDPDAAAVVMRHINPVDPDKMCDPKQPHRPEIIALATAINQARRNGGVAENLPLTVYNDTPPTDPAHEQMHWVQDADGSPSLILFIDGAPYYAFDFTDDDPPTPKPFSGDLSTMSPAVQYRTVDSIQAAVGPALNIALNATKNDPALEDVKYTVLEGSGPTAGAAQVDNPTTPSASQDAPSGTSGERITLSRTSGIEGLSFDLDSPDFTTDNKGIRYMTVKVKNYYLRHVGVYLRWKKPDGSADTWWRTDYPDNGNGAMAFYDAMGMARSHQFFNDFADVKDSVFWGFVSNRSVIMGIPLPPDWTVFKVPIPPTSSQADLLFASAGIGATSRENAAGWVLTALVDLGLPGYFLAAGLRNGPADAPLFKDALTNTTVLQTLVGIGLAMGVYSATGAPGSEDYKRYAKALAAILVNTGADRLRYAIVRTATKDAAEDAIPFVGQALYVAGLAANASQLLQTIVEVAASKPTTVNSLTATWDPVVRILPDPLNIRGGFPESATKYEAYFYFNDSDTVKAPKDGLAADIGNTAVPHIDLRFSGIPEGGTATIKVNLLNETGEFVAGYATRTVTNSAHASPPDADGVNYSLQLTENLVPINAGTNFIHKDRIGPDGTGKLVWLGTVGTDGKYVAPPAPTRTHTTMNCSSVDPGLCGLHDITLNIEGHSVGYAWQSFARDAVTCGSGTVSSGQRFFTENLSLLNNGAGGPESLHVNAGCGWLEYRPGVAYDLVGHATGSNVFLFPGDLAGHTAYFIQKVAVDATLSFAPADAVVGRFAMPPTDVAIHPSGYAVSVNRDFNKLEVLDLSATPVPLAEAPAARMYSGTGDRRGLLRHPIAVAVNHDGDILVLEQGNARVSALDAFGAVRPIFGDSADPSPHFALSGIPDTATLLDLDVEGTGMIFVLGYQGGGTSADDYFVQVYSGRGTLVDTVTGIAAGRMAVDHFRNIFTLNYETIDGGNAIRKPSISMWTPEP